jgi:DNA-binding response OmpR family regulator
MIERVLSGDGYAVVSARNGEEALRHAGAGRIDLVLLDFGALMENPQEFARLLEVIERLLRESRCEG